MFDLTVKIVRVAKVPTAEFRSVLDERHVKELGLVGAIGAKFRPLANGIHFYARDDGVTLVSMEMVVFHIKATGIPFAGIVQTDPLDEKAMHRADGALQGELARIGVFTMPSEYETRCEYEGGNQ